MNLLAIRHTRVPLLLGIAAGAVLAPGGTALVAARDASPPILQTPLDAPALQARGRAGRSPRVLPGVDVLAASDGGPLHGLRVGLLTNHTGVNAEGRSSIDVLNEHPGFELVALFSPEHGIRGTAEAGEIVRSGRDERTGLPIHSLYGDTKQPTAAMLRGLDALAFDIQDIGARYYTYVWTMALALEAAAEHDVKFVVLDRPNPIGGAVQGNVLEPEHASLVGLYPVPMRHGLTPGELARWLNDAYGFGAQLEVVRAAGWRRDMWFDETGLPWLPPSPNMPSLESATHYPGTCLFEATNLSVGRGTPAAFQQIGAPWLDADALIARLRARALPGVRFEAVEFTPVNPGDRRWGGTRVRGIRFHATDRETYDPIATALATFLELRRLHPDELEIHAAGLARLAGTERLRPLLMSGTAVDDILATWQPQREAFEDHVRPFLLYD